VVVLLLMLMMLLLMSTYCSTVSAMSFILGTRCRGGVVVVVDVDLLLDCISHELLFCALWAHDVLPVGDEPLPNHRRLA